MFNNDLVGKDRPWGPYKDLSKWQRSLYDRYKQMVYRCERPKYKDYRNYGALGIKCEFRSFSEYYQSLKSCTRGIVNGYRTYSFQDFKRDPDQYEIDKDIKFGHGTNYKPTSVLIVDKNDNNREHAQRQSNLTSNFGSKNWATNKVPKRVIVQYSTGDIVEYSSTIELANLRGRTDSLIRMYIRGSVKLPSDIVSIAYKGVVSP